MDESVYVVTDCKLCKEAIKTIKEQIVCTTCTSQYHRTCVKNDNMQSWGCPTCCKDNPPSAPRSLRSKKHSEGKSNRTSSSVAKALLDSLEEEKKLLEAQAKEKELLLKETHEKQLQLLKKKQDALQEIASRSGSHRSDISVPSVTSQEKVEKWIDSQNLQSTEKIDEPKVADTENINPLTKSVGGTKKKGNFPSLPEVPPPVMNSTMDLPKNSKVQDNRISFLIPEDVGESSNQNTRQKKSSISQYPEQDLPRNSTFILPSQRSRYAAAETSSKFNLSREEIAARHVVKELPQFDGSPRKWPKFISSFYRSTAVCGFNDQENLERLSHSLSGRAYKAVESSLSLEENVPRILETLELMFGKPEFVIRSLIDDLNQSPSPSADNIDSIIRYSLEVENISVTMKVAKLSEHLWNPILLTDMVERLPCSLKLEWASYKYVNSNCNIEVFALWLKQKAMMFSTILVKPPVFSYSEKSTKGKHSLHVHQETTDRKCLVCAGRCRRIEDCEKFKELKLNQKWEIVKKHQICRICLSKHKSKLCSKDSLCGIDECQYRHHQLLHNKKVPEVAAASPEDVNVHSNESRTYFKILPVCLRNGNKSMEVFAMLDDGSSITLIDESVAKYLELGGEHQPLCLRWTKGVERRDDSSKLVSLKVSQFRGGPEFLMSDVHTVDNLSLPTQSVDMEELTQLYDHLKGVPMKSFHNAQPLLLIGLNHTKFMAVKKYHFGKDNEPSAAKTTLGWCIFGKKSSEKSELFQVHHCDCQTKLDQKLEDMVLENYSLDAIGTSNSRATPRSNEDIRAMEILETTTKYNGSQYEVSLLWRYDNINIPENFQLAVRRHKCLEKRFVSEPELRQIISDQLQEYVRKGYARKLQQVDPQESSWFLPIFVVRNPNKPNKIRLVWDAAAERKGVSLNKLLLKGPDLLASLPGVLLRFREHKVALSGDIKEMFHQIIIREQDRKYQRFIWRFSEDSEFEVYEMNVMTFGASCSPSCSQYIKNINAERFRETYENATRAIQNNHYVDDWLESVDTPEEAIRLAKDVRHIHQQGGFSMRNWISNNALVVQQLNETSTTDELKSLEIGPSMNADKILGMFWRTTSDVFTYIVRMKESSCDIFNGNKIPTKREFLSILMSLFDPLGLISNVMIYPKILLQRIWRSNTSWDQTISEEHHQQWMVWAKELNKLNDVEIPRWIGLESKGSNIELHCFVDASEDAFGSVVYFKVKNGDDVRCSLVIAKSRVAPLRGLSVPRLELQAAVLGTRLVKFVTENLSEQHSITKKYFWTDSETVMKWIYSDSRRYTQYVGCRIGEILELSKAHEWNWIAGTKNVADSVTKMRVQSSEQLREWFHGPSFLYHENYPVKKLYSKQTSEELRPQHQEHHVSHHEHYQDTEYRVEKWRKLRRIFAFVFRFVDIMKLLKDKNPIIRGPLANKDYVRAENFLLKKAQQEGYANEYLTLQEGGIVRDRRSHIFKDAPFLDEYGVIRSRSRIQFASSALFDTRNPILLPKNHRITSMILNFYHERYHHQYVATVCNEVKQKYIIPRLKVTLNSLRRQCQYCRNKDAKPEVPIEGDLPPARLTPFTLPFTFVGIDFFGPMHVVVGRRKEKRWCMLVTCLTTRAVHLEVAHYLTTDSCILALRRFMNRRGKPREIYSDNGTNFRGARRELREMWEKIEKDRLAETFVDEVTKWMFIPPASPHMGGAWERMVRSVKNSLQVALHTRTPSDELLLTMLAEVENIINNRPLTYVSIERESDEAITPNHLLLGSSSGVKPVGDFNTESSALRANWHKSQLFSKMFWKRWTKEYLPTLSRRTKWFLPSSREIKVGDVVVVLCEDKPGSWPKGRILEVNRGKDGQVRSAKVQMEFGIYTRPVSKLAVLDLCAKEKDGTLESCTGIPGGSVESRKI